MVIATNPALDLNSLELLDREDLIKLVTGMAGGGVFLNFHGKRSAMEIAKRVRPRVTRRVSKFVRFQNAVHPGYSGLNEFELEFANALDKSRKTWCRNPSRGGFEIPLLDRGNTK